MEKTNEAILETLRKIEDRQASMDRDMEKDRQELQNITIEVQSLKAEVAELRKATNLSALRTRDRVAEVVEPVINATESLTGQIKKSKVVVIKEKLTWWQKIWKH